MIPLSEVEGQPAPEPLAPPRAVNGTPRPDCLARYGALGFRTLFYQPRQKGPSGPEGVGWTARSDRPEDWHEGLNVGVFTGHEVSPGRFLADVDIDCADPRVLQLAARLFPRTCNFGRPSKPTSHLFYTTPEPVVTVQYKNIDDKTIVELRGTATDGALTCQTMVPPSVHPSGEVLAWAENDIEVGHAESADVLRNAVRALAVAALVVLHVGDRGFGHDVRLPLLGLLLKAGLPERDVIRIGEAIAYVTHNDVADVSTVVTSTARRLASGGRVSGRVALARVLGDGGAPVARLLEGWLGGAGQFVTSGGKVTANSQENVKRALHLLDVSLSHDTFAERMLVRLGDDGPERPLDDPVYEGLWLRIDEQFQFRPTKDFFDTVVRSVARMNAFHPVQEYLNGLRWDGEARLDRWLVRYGGAADNDYTRAVGALVLTAAVKRARHPGCKFDELLVLESGQGLLKSSALRALCPNEDWFSDDLPLGVDAKQMIERTSGKWLIEAGELSGMRKSQVEQLKASLSRQVDGPCRMAYGRLPVERPRSFIIIGTTNSDQYLKDATGNRRFWPVRVGKFDVEGLRRDRDQLWAEAAAREAAGASIRLDPDLYEAATKAQEERRVEDAWEPLIEKWLDKAPENEPPNFYQKWRESDGRLIRCTSENIWGVLFMTADRRDQRGTERIAAIMQRFGFRRGTVRPPDGGKVCWGWRRPARGQGDLEFEGDE